jgi:hypothetical protein
MNVFAMLRYVGHFFCAPADCFGAPGVFPVYVLKEPLFYSSLRGAQRRGTSELASAERPQGGPEGVSVANNLQTIDLPWREIASLLSQ